MEFRILGPVEVLDRGQAIRLGSTKERVVLARLLLSANEVVPLDSLVEDVWEGGATDQASGNLRVYVSRLRKTLRSTGEAAEDVIATRPPGYLIRVDPDELDAMRFERLLAHGRAALGREDPHTAAEVLQEALGLWRGGALADVAHLAFAAPEVARLEELRWSAIEERVEADLARGRHDELAAELPAFTAAAPFRERLWGQRMVALYRCGRQADALRAYQDLREVLADGLGLDPGPALVELERAVLMQDPTLDWHAAPGPLTHRSASVDEPSAVAVSAPVDIHVEGPPVASAAAPLGLARHTRFVGRTGELEQLRATLAKAWAGHVEMAFLAGEPGIGKSRLALEFAQEAAGEGGRVLLGRCDEGTVVPYQPFVQAVAHLLRTEEGIGARVWSTPGGAELARLLPAAVVPDVAEPSEHAEPDIRRYWLFEAFLALFTSAAEAAPRVLVLDDLQWADLPTLRLLRHLAEHARPAPLLVVGTYRNVELTPGHALSSALADIDRIRPATRLLLRGLDDNDVGALLEAWAGTSVPTSVTRTVLQESEGNPFFIEELLRHLSESGVWQPAGGGDDLSVDRLGVPERIRSVVERRIARLSPEAQQVLAVSSVLPRGFSLALVEAVAGLDEDGFLEAVDDVLLAGLLEEDRESGRYRFAHALVRRCVYDALSAARRTRLHRRMADALARREAAGQAALLPQLAYHTAAAVTGPADYDDARLRLVAAARQAIDQLAYEEAVSYFERALELAERVGVEDPASHAELLLGMAEAQAKGGDIRTARATLETAAALARQRHSSPDLLGRIALAATVEPWGVGYVVPTGQHVGLLEEALETGGPADTPLRAQLLGRLAVELYSREHSERAVELSREAVAIARRLGDRALEFTALQSEHLATLGPDVPLDEQLQRSADLLALAGDLGGAGMVLSARALHLSVLVQAGLMDEAKASVERMAALADEIQVRTYFYWVAAYRSTFAMTEGRFDEAESLAVAAFAQGREVDEQTALVVFGAQSLVVAWHRGRLADLLPTIESLVSGFDGFPTYEAALAFVYADLGAREVKAAYERFATSGFRDLPRGDLWVVAMFLLALTCARLDDTAGAEQLYELIVPYADRVVVNGTVSVCLGSMATAAGVVARVLGRTDEACAHLTAAVARNTEIGAPPLVAVAELELARTLAGCGDPDRREQAPGHADRAASIAESLGMPVVLDAARDIAGRST